MKAVKFHTLIDEEGVIRVPEGFQLAPGEAEVIVLQPEGNGGRTTSPPITKSQPEQMSDVPLIMRLARIAEAHGVRDLPSDLAENHDHYIHGLPKGIDSL